MDIRMMHQLLSARDGQYIGRITGRPAEKGNGHLSGDSSLSAAAMGTNDGAAEGSIEARSISINVHGYDCRSTTVINVR